MLKTDTANTGETGETVSHIVSRALHYNAISKMITPTERHVPYMAPPTYDQFELPQQHPQRLPVTSQRQSLDPLISLRDALVNDELIRHHPDLVQQLVNLYHRYIALCRNNSQKPPTLPYHIGLCTQCPAAHCYLY